MCSYKQVIKVRLLYVGIISNKLSYWSIDALHYAKFKKENPQLCIYISADLNIGNCVELPMRGIWVDFLF